MMDAKRQANFAPLSGRSKQVLSFRAKRGILGVPVESQPLDVESKDSSPAGSE